MATKSAASAAAKKSDAPKAEKKAATPAAAKKAAKADAPAKGVATIKIEKGERRGRVRGAVNGQQFDLPVDAEVQVTAAQLTALTNSGVKFSTITPLAGEDADEGSSASSTIGGTATRLDPPNVAVDGEGEPKDPPELRQVTDEELTKGSQEANAAQAEKTE